jgi:hypothetical protein
MFINNEEYPILGSLSTHKKRARLSLISRVSQKQRSSKSITILHPSPNIILEKQAQNLNIVHGVDDNKCQ